MKTVFYSSLYVMLPITGFLLFYALVGFVQLEFDFRKMSEELRAAIAIFGFCSAIIGIMVAFAINQTR
jgi:hypothetical protein